MENKPLPDPQDPRFDSLRDREYPPYAEPLRILASQVDQYRDQAATLGRLQAGRPLLECPHCGLLEDELADMRLIVTNPDQPGVDTGLRFGPMDDEGSVWWCPGCGHPFSTGGESHP